MELQDLKIQKYVFLFLKEMNALYDFADKTILFMFYQADINNAKVILDMGAKKVIYYTPEDITPDNENISYINIQRNNLSGLQDNSIDLVIGLEILEHINDLEDFFAQVKRIMKSDAKLELQGSPMWTCHYGHHLWLENRYLFYDKTNPFAPWEHLIYISKNEMLEALQQKDIPQTDCLDIVNWIYNKDEISRHSPTEIICAATGQNDLCCTSKSSFSSSTIEQYKVDNWYYSFKRFHDKKTSLNEYFILAKHKYVEDDLTTIKVVLKMARV